MQSEIWSASSGPRFEAAFPGAIAIESRVSAFTGILDVDPALPVEQLYTELESKVRALRPTEDLTPLREAYEFAAEHHKGQSRDSGEPYMSHPVAVTLTLAEMQMD